MAKKGLNLESAKDFLVFVPKKKFSKKKIGHQESESDKIFRLRLCTLTSPTPTLS